MDIGGHVKRKFVTGLFVLIPLLVTIYVILLVVAAFDNVAAPLIRHISEGIFGKEVYIPGIGIIIFLVVAYLTGVFTSNLMGKRVVASGERVLTRIPIVKGIYNSVKEMTDAFSSEKKKSFQEVVLVEYPSPGRYAVGFVVNRKDLGEKGIFCSVFVPTTPNPTSGFLIMVPEKEVVVTTMPVDRALKYVVSIGTTEAGREWTGIKSG